jgi:hypothetical protein
LKPGQVCSGVQKILRPSVKCEFLRFTMGFQLFVCFYFWSMNVIGKVLAFLSRLYLMS